MFDRVDLESDRLEVCVETYFFSTAFSAIYADKLSLSSARPSLS